MTSNSRVTPLDRHIAAKIKDLRIAADVRMVKVAGHLGISYQSYQSLEAGETSVRATTIQLLSEFYGVPESHFFGESPAPEIINQEAIGTVSMILRKALPEEASAISAFAVQQVHSRRSA